ncbi:MAG: hypothetical protein AAGD43_03250 [Pseudomonadota bacterium]
MTQMIAWLPEDVAITAERMAIRVDAPSFREFAEDLMRRAVAGDVRVEFRIISSDPLDRGTPLEQVPFNHPIPATIENRFGELVDVDPKRDVEMLVLGTK